MLLEHQNYSSYLKALLSERQAKNAAYSLRAYARDIGVPASHLSMVLNGKGHLSVERATEVAIKLGLSGSDAEFFRLLVEYAQAKSPELKDTLASRMRQIAGQRAIRDLSVDSFKLIADWYHIPLLVMMEIPGEKMDAASVARRLGISKVDAEVALERLERLEMIERQEDGSYTRWPEYARVVSNVPNLPLRRYHQQIFEKASRVLDEQAPSERYVGSETVAISPELLPIVADEIERFRASLLARIEAASRTTAPTEVYNLNLSFFRITCPKDQPLKRERALAGQQEIVSGEVK